MGFTVPCLNYKHLKAKINGVLAELTVAMVMYCAMKMIPMIGQFFFETMIVAAVDKYSYYNDP